MVKGSKVLCFRGFGVNGSKQGPITLKECEWFSPWALTGIRTQLCGHKFTITRAGRTGRVSVWVTQPYHDHLGHKKGFRILLATISNAPANRFSKEIVENTKACLHQVTCMRGWPISRHFHASRAFQPIDDTAQVVSSSSDSNHRLQ